MARTRHLLILLAAMTALVAVAAVPATAKAPAPAAHASYWDTGDDPGTDDPADDGFDDEEWPGDGPAEEDLPPDPDPMPVPEPAPLPPPVVKPTIGGKTARIRTNGKAAIPRGAPNGVRAILAAGNKIVGKPYKWGGGHRKLVDRGYDCSGAVSFALIKSGHLVSPLVSGSFARWGGKGRGHWVTIYANRKHVYMEVAGLRLDTSAVGDPGGRQGVRWRPLIGKRKGFKVRHLTKPGRHALRSPPRPRSSVGRALPW